MKKRICLLLSVLLIISSMSCCFGIYSSAFTEIEDGCIKSIEQLFSQSSSDFDVEFAIKSFNLAHAAFGKKDAVEFYQTDDDIVAQFDDYGFKSTTYNYDVMSQMDSIAFAIGEKVVKINGEDTTILALTVRGGTYKSEWAGNFHIGDNSDEFHTGFKIARDEILTDINEYLIKNNVGNNVKFWFTGYSRGGAISNLTAAAIIEDNDKYPAINALNIDSSDVYAYTFEAPRGTTANDAKSDKYGYIFNVVNPTDIVPLVAPIGFDFNRYGQDVFTPSAENSYNYEDYLPELRKYFKEFEGKHYSGKYRTFVDGSFSEFTLGSFMQEYVNNVVVSERVGNDRNYYSENLQDALMIVFGSIFGGRTDYFEGYFDDLGAEIKNIANTSFDMLNIGDIMKSDDISKEVNDLIDSYVTYYNNLTALTLGKTKSNLSGVGKFLYESFAYDFDYLLTLLINVDNISYAHFPELTKAWLFTLKDTSYFDSYHSNYKTLKIDGCCDVDVFDSNEKLVASFDDTDSNLIFGRKIAYSIDKDGYKSIQLPMNEEFTVKITSTSDGDIYYCCDEINMSSFKTVSSTTETIKTVNGQIIELIMENENTSKDKTEVSLDHGNNVQSEDCDCICHKDGVSKIIFNLLTYVWEFFGTNKVCECSAVHY